MQSGLQTPFSALITQTFAHKLFGDEDPMGKTVVLESKWFDDTYTITGILKDIPSNSIWELAPDLITATFPPKNTKEMDDIQNRYYVARTYILLKPEISVAALKEKLPDFAERFLGADRAQRIQYKLMPLTKLHFQ